MLRRVERKVCFGAFDISVDKVFQAVIDFRFKRVKCLASGVGMSLKSGSRSGSTFFESRFRSRDSSFILRGVIRDADENESSSVELLKDTVGLVAGSGELGFGCIDQRLGRGCFLLWLPYLG